eukprot:m.1660162 g.1660162  ORF g.1660162 m.1660162 type:complete len:68 (-) comp120877_c0_seq1:53-256(-)
MCAGILDVRSISFSIIMRHLSACTCSRATFQGTYDSPHFSGSGIADISHFSYFSGNRVENRVRMAGH